VHAARSTSAQIATTGAHFCSRGAHNTHAQCRAERSRERSRAHTTYKYNNSQQQQWRFSTPSESCNEMLRRWCSAGCLCALGVLRVVLTQSVSLCANVFLRGTMEEGRSDDGNNAGKIMAAEWSCDERTRALSRNNAPAFAPLLLLLLSLSLALHLPASASLSRSLYTNSYRGGKDCCFYSIKLFN
jgi:hypothetical protein